MLVVKNYKAKNGFECVNGLLVINSLSFSSSANVTLTHNRDEVGGYGKSESLNSSINFSAAIYKDKATYDAGGTPVEAVTFINPYHTPDSEHSPERVTNMSVTFGETLDEAQAMEAAYNAIKDNLKDELTFVVE